MSDKLKASTEAKPGDGIRSLPTSKLFRVVNFELYTKPNAVIMGLGLIGLAGYYAAIQENGQEQFLKKKSKWD
ncbi:hypothetical protein Trydic_g10352 [Trypoxylus dichotomus]